MNWQTINENCRGVLVHNRELFVGCRGIIKVYDLSSKALVREFGKEVFANWVWGLVIHKNTLLATDCTEKLHVFDINGKHQNSFRVDGMLDGGGMVIHNHKLFICDDSGCCVKVVDPDTGQLLKTIGSSRGDGKNQFNSPKFITSADNRLYVTDYSNNRVKVMDENGAFVDQFSVSQPTGIAISGKDIIVTENGKSQLSLYDKNHQFVKVLLKCCFLRGVFITDGGQIIAASEKIYMSSDMDDQQRRSIDSDTIRDLRKQLQQKDELIQILISAFKR